MNKVQEIRRVLGMEPEMRIALLGEELVGWRSPLSKAGVRVIADPPFDLVVATQPQTLDGVMRLGALVPHLARGGRIWLLEYRFARSYMSWASQAADLTRTFGLQKTATASVDRFDATRFELPALGTKEKQALARKLSLDEVTRMAVFGRRLWPLGPLCAAARGDAHVWSPGDPGRGPLELIVFVGEMWGGDDLPRLRKRLAPDGRLVVVFEKSRTGPANVRQQAAHAHLEPSDKVGSLPIGPDGWWSQTYVLGAAAKRATKKVAKKKAKARSPVRKTVAAPKPKIAAKLVKPATPAELAKATKALRADPSEENLERWLRAHAVNACVIHKMVRLRSKEPTSVAGGTTWARRGERWPERHVHELSIRIDELPFVPEELRGIAFLSVFSDGEGLVAREHASLDELEPIHAPSDSAYGVSKRSPAYAITWRAVVDHPDDSGASSLLRDARIDVDDATLESVRESELLDHFRSTKVGGWPTTIQSALPREGFVLQCGEYGDAGLYYLHRAKRRWASSAYCY